ncbi:MAG: carboxypeptidase-like regulatory domain-containing protein [Cyclobacteriaceae bacterium]
MKGLLVVVLSMCSAFVSAQSTITGRVVDQETGEGLIGAHIYLMKDWRNGVIAGVDGAFTLQVDPSIPDSLIISFIGFQEVVVALSESTIVEMEPIEIEGEVVVITAQRPIAEEFKYMKISKMDIYTNPAAKADPILAVNALPSATTTDESANISLRGSSPLETSVFLNNVPVYDAVRYSQLNGIGTFSIFNTAIIRDVVVFPGNPPLEFGNTSSGIISLSTDDRVLKDNSNSVVLSLASIGVTREQKISKNQSLKLFSNWQPSAAIKAINETSLESIKSFKSGDLGLYWYGSNTAFNWKVLNYTVLEGYEFNFEHPSFVGVFDQKKQRSFLVSSLEKSVGKGTLSLNNGLSTSNGDYEFSSSKFNVEQRDFFGGLNYFRSSAKISLKTGISYDLRKSSVMGNFHEFSYALASDHPTAQVNEDGKSETAEGFVYIKYAASDKITIGSGARKNMPLAEQKDYFSQQLNIAYASNSWLITAGIGTYFKNGLRENTSQSFTSESDQISLDIKYEKDQLQAAFSLFDKKNKIDEGGYEAKGAELFVDYRFSPKFKASSSLTWLDAQADENESYQYDLSYFIRGNITYSPGSFWTIEGVLVAREGLPFSPVEGANFDATLNAYEPFFADQERRLAGYSNISFSLSKMFPISEKVNVIAFASVSNVLDTQNIRAYDYNFDYTARSEALYSRRTSYFGAVISF